MNTPARQRGITLVEQLIVMAIFAVLLGAALPSLDQIRARRHLEGAAAQLETELQFTRGLAVARDASVRIGFESDGAGSCYVIHTGGPNDCSCAGGKQAVCGAGAEAIRTVRFDADSPVALRSNVRSMVFAPETGTVTPTATLRMTNRRGDELRLVVNIMGRVRQCTPTPDLRGHPRC